MRPSVLLIAIACALLASRAGATVYSWRDSDGALHISNNSDEVPADQPQALRTFTSRSAARDAAEGAAADRPSGSTAADPSGEYERGIETGMRLAEQQIVIASELARTMSPTAPPTVIAAPYPVAQEAPVSVSIVRTPARFYGEGDSCFGGPCWGGWPGWSPWFFGPAFIGGSFHRHGRSGFVHGQRSGRFFAGGRGFNGSRGIFGATLH